MAIQFWLTFNNGAEKMRLAVNPSSVSVASPHQYEDFSVSKLGEISIIGDAALKEFSFSSFFPMVYSRAYCEHSSFPWPWTAVQRLERWRASKRPIRFVVTGTPINHLVTIRDFDYDAERFGSDGEIYYSITLKEYKPVTIRTVDLSKPVPAPGASPRPNPTTPPKTHIVKKNESLWTIARKYYGDGNLWRKIYNANQKVIGKNPHHLHAKMKLTIPPK